MLSMFKIITTVFVGFVLLKLYRRARYRELGWRETVGWLLLWLLVLAAAWWPHATDVVASWIGVGRGADLLIFLSILALFMLASWLLSRMAKIEREITVMVRHEALRSGELGIKNKELGTRGDTISDSDTTPNS